MTIRSLGPIGPARRFYLSDDDKGGGSATAEAEAAETAKAEAEAEAEEARLAAEKEAAEGNDEEKAEAERVEAEAKAKEAAEQATAEAIAKAKDEITPEEARALAEKHGFKIAVEEKKEPATPPVIPDMRTRAYEEAGSYPAFLEKDEDGELVLTAAGVAWAENRAIQLHVEETNAEQQRQAALTQLQSRKAEINTHYATEFKKLKTPVPDEIVEVVAKDFTDIVVGYGLAAFDESEQGSANAQKLRTTAYYIALGKQKEREIEASKEGGEEGDRSPDPVRGGGGGEGLYAGLDKATVDWLKGEFAQTKNGGKPPTKAQIDELKLKGAI